MSEKIIGGINNPITAEKVIGGDGVFQAEAENNNSESQVGSHANIGSIKERIALSTKAGGLEQVPSNFEDKEGDWITVNSDNSFEVLYLDFRQHDIITPLVVGKNYKIILDFWRKKNQFFAGGGREKLKPKYGEDNIINAEKKLVKAYEQLKTQDGIDIYFKELDSKRIRKGLESVNNLIKVSLADGALTKGEANEIISIAIANELTESEIRDFLLNEIRQRGYKPRATKNNSDPFDNRWMTDEKWKEAQGRFTTINGVPISSLEEYGEVLFNNEEYATKHLRTINYIIQEVTKLHSTDKAMEFEEIVEKEQDPEKRNLKVIYHLNPSIPFRVYDGGGIYETIQNLLAKGFENYEIYEKLSLLFSKEHIQIWLKENDPSNAAKLPANSDYRSFLEFIYKVNDQFPFYLKSELITTPKELVEKIKLGKTYWYRTIEYFKNSYIPTWLQGIGKGNWLSAYDTSVNQIIDSRFHNDEEINLASIQSLMLIVDPSLAPPKLVADKNAIELLTIEGSDQVIAEPISVSIQNSGFAKATLYLDTEIEGVTIDLKEFPFFSQDNRTNVRFNLFVDSSKLVKNKIYELNVVIQTLYEKISIPIQLKAVFPKRAFTLILVKYAVIFLSFFGLIRYGLGILTNNTGWLGERLFHYFPLDVPASYLPIDSNIYFILFLLLVVGLFGSIFIVRKVENI